jgi:hypothetical protein
MSDPVAVGFDLACRLIPLARILPTRVIAPQQLRRRAFAALQSSIAEVGIIEPLVVYPLPRAQDQYLLLDGHLRLEVLKALGTTETLCLLASDDEGFTYNRHVNHLIPIQAHIMLLQALDNGVSEERAARMLSVDISNIRAKRNLMRDICDEAVGVLKTSPISTASLRLLRQVKPERQVEIAEMLVITGNFSANYCQALVTATKPHLRGEIKPAKKADGTLSAEAVARMQDELDTLQRELQVREDSYGKNFLNLMLVRGYLENLLGNANVARYLQTHHPEIHRVFQQIIDSTSLDG